MNVKFVQKITSSAVPVHSLRENPAQQFHCFYFV